MYNCNKCSKVYKNRQHLSRHRKSCLANQSFKCFSCSRSFKRKDALKRHSETCRVKDKICKICHKEFDFPVYLQRNLKSHQEKETFKCEKCGKPYERKNHLKSHIEHCQKDNDTSQSTPPTSQTIVI